MTLRRTLVLTVDVHSVGFASSGSSKRLPCKVLFLMWDDYCQGVLVNGPDARHGFAMNIRVGQDSGSS